MAQLRNASIESNRSRQIVITRGRAATCVLLALVAAASPLSAQDEEPGRDGVPRIATARRGGPIHIDGRVNEPAWSAAEPATRFVQREPVEGAPAEESTEVRVLYDGSALYVAAVMRESNPAGMGRQLVRRDEGGQYDYFELSLDTDNDRRTGYRFRVSAAGVQSDAYLYDDVRDDPAWDAVWESGVHHDSAGWSVEIRVPLSQLRYRAAEGEQSWGVNFSRRRLASNERTYFALESQTQHGVVSSFGRLQGLDLPRGPGRLEIRPYALTRAETGPSEHGDPFFDGSDVDAQVGFGLRYGLGSSYTLDATINPDFGQVEVDPAVINLSAFETFFPEKRPFFVEDAQIFDFELSGRRNRLFYSRRIGREPQGDAPDDFDFESTPGETTILGAAKLTGRSSSGLSLGALTAVTSREHGEAFDSLTGERVEFSVEPPTVYGVARARQDFRDGASLLGGIFAGMHRDLPGNGSLDFLTRNAFAVGLDFEHNWGGANSRDWVIFGWFAHSWVTGSREALLEVQTSSQHFFQRPDATRFSLDSTRTSLSGLNWEVQFERRSAEHWTGAIWLGQSTPGFEIGDIGFWTSTEQIGGGVRLGYQEITPGDIFRGYEITVRQFLDFRHEALDRPFSLNSWDRAYKGGGLRSNAEFEFLNYWRLNLDFDYEPERRSDTATRGGPLMVAPGATGIEVGLSTDRREKLAVGARAGYENGHRGGGHSFEAGLELAVRPAPNVELSLEPTFRDEHDPAQYVTTTDDIGFQPTFGPRYVFSDLDRTSLSMQTRFNVAFTPDLTFQLFAQPLIEAGDFTTYKALARSESFDFDVFSPGTAVETGGEVRCVDGTRCKLGDQVFVDSNADGTTDFSFEDESFNIRSLRLSAVLRWEYRPGSTVFLVWQQSREDAIDDGDFDFGRDASGLWRADSDNVLILKVNYWLGL